MSLLYATSGSGDGGPSGARRAQRASALAAIVVGMVVLFNARIAHGACLSDCSGAIACSTDSADCSTCCGANDCGTCNASPELDGYAPLAAVALAAGGLLLSRWRSRRREQKATA